MGGMRLRCWCCRRLALLVLQKIFTGWPCTHSYADPTDAAADHGAHGLSFADWDKADKAAMMGHFRRASRRLAKDHEGLSGYGDARYHTIPPSRVFDYRRAPGCIPWMHSCVCGCIVP